MPVARLLATLLLATVLAATLGACSTARPWINAPRSAATELDSVAIAKRDPSALFAVTLSGGGARAAAFGYGVLQ